MNARSVFINRNYTLFMAGSFVGATGSWIQSVAMGWLAFELGNSGFVLGLVGFARMVPLLFLSFPVGAMGDRYERRTILLASQAGAVATAIPLAVAVWLGYASVPLLVGLAFLAGIADAFAWPIWSVFIKDLVGPERLRSAVAINSARFNLTRIIGPSIGGLLLAAYGPAVCFVIAAILTVGVMASIVLVRLPPRVPGSSGPWLPAMQEGLRYGLSTPFVRRVLLVTAGMGLFGMPYQNVLPAIARDGLGVGPEGLGLLMTSVGAGAIVGALLTGSRLMRRHARALIVLLPIGVGAGLVGLSLAPLGRSMPLAAISLAAIGFFSIAHMSIANATLQLAVRESIVGRVMGLFTVVQAGMMPIGSLALGAVVDLAGLTAALALSGVLAAAVALTFGRGLLSPPALSAAEGDERRADAEEQERGRDGGGALQVGRPARQADRRL